MGRVRVMSRERPIKAIETRVYGCRFRSRLEARWAVFLTEAGFRWEYEPEGIELAAGRYLPDFRVSRSGSAVSVWLEIKPKLGTDPADDPRWTELAARSGAMLFTVRGLHRPGDDCEHDHTAQVFHPDGSVYRVRLLWQAPQYDNAWRKANSARFDGTDEPGFFTHPAGRGPAKRRTRRGRR